MGKKNDTIRQSWKPSYEGWTKQPNRRERVSKADRELEICPISLLSVSREHQANSHNTNWEDLVQTHAGCVFATSASLRPYEHWLLDLVGHVILVSSIHSHSYPFFPQSTWFPDFWREVPDGDLQFRLSKNNVWLWVSTLAPICY